MNTQTHPDTTTLAGKIAVMQAALEGKKIQVRTRDSLTWEDASDPCWDWIVFNYRIAQSPIAPGHNPDGITVDQAPDGRRLMTEEEVGRAGCDFRKREESGIWTYENGCWSRLDDYCVNSPDCIYSVPTDWVDPLLPKPKRRVPWSCPEDVPGPVCWIKCSEKSELLQVTAVASDGIGALTKGGGIWLRWDQISRRNILHSTDRKTWLPCEQEVEG